jgi:hypothetical protein
MKKLLFLAAAAVLATSAYAQTEVPEAKDNHGQVVKTAASQPSETGKKAVSETAKSQSRKAETATDAEGKADAKASHGQNVKATATQDAEGGRGTAVKEVAQDKATQDARTKSGSEASTDKASAAQDNHGNTVKSTAQSSTAEGADKGKAVKEVAASKSQAKPARVHGARGARPARTARPASAGRPTGAGRPAGAGRPTGIGRP